MNYWLFKSEPSCFSYDDLLHRPKKTEHWDGVRNYQARNFLRDSIKKGDLGIFYHSNTTPPCAVGVVEIVREGYPDFTAWEPHSDHFDPTSTPQNPRWFMVDVQAKKKFSREVPLSEMREISDLCDMPLLQKGNRLSVLPLSQKHFHILCGMGGG